ncbi:SGNH hydrolase-type esterase domain-containing protein [Emericellopsis atlantica]|uniref:SGNH hydrolase-type esterase domain-containing protein n=1 Tax=Emericellopsis atlantica TaxID=2614577 RepID=A0A9P7ZTH3_9HYPO|nr:SGNH hydrolase-type esterase domain-containing protein [Emericellopsis atlantica]KAG9258009.1 SGNH hydrolase-type esterase domain-containing protein [Emericellopsis atlantica]
MASTYPQFVLLGDSLFQQSMQLQEGFSFQAALQTLCCRKLDVINRGFSGYNTRNLLSVLEGVFPERGADTPAIEYLAILIGANDAVIDGAPTKQHVDLDEYKSNLTKIVNHPRVKQHKPKIFIITPPPVDELKHTKLDLEKGLSSSIRTSAISASYSEKAREVARENEGTVLIDLWQTIMHAAIALAPGDYQSGGPWLGTPENGKAGGLDELLPDGLHLSGKAYQIFYETLRPHVERVWEGQPDNAGFVYPTWEEMNNVSTTP